MNKYKKYIYHDKKKYYKNIFNQMNKLENVIYDNNKDINKEINNNKIYELSIIKNDKNEDVMMIKIKHMIKPTNKDLEELKEFLKKYKNLKELYIDIRGNTGGNSRCYLYLYNLILNDTLKFQYNNIKCYFKYTKFNEPFIDYKFNNCKDIIIKSDILNKQYTHYAIQHLENKTYPTKLLYGYEDNINYQGKIFIIMDHHNFSSAQCLLDESKGNKNITILGDEKSGGFGIYGNLICNYDATPTVFILPKTKILCYMDLFYYDIEKYLTQPDKPIPEWLCYEG